MNYSILRINAIGGLQLGFDAFYQTNKLAQLSYDTAIRQMQEAGYIIPGSWASEMRSLGNEAHDLVIDSQLLQSHWLKEFKPCEEEKGIYDVLALQLQHYKPEIVLIYAGAFWFLSKEIRSSFFKQFPFIRHLIGLWGDDLPAGRQFEDFADLSLVFAADYPFYQSFKKAQIPCEVILNCFDHKLIEQPSFDSPRLHDFLFAGNSGYGFEDHRDRFYDLDFLIQKTSLKVYCNEPPFLPQPPLFKKFAKELICRSKRSWVLKTLQSFGLSNTKNKTLQLFHHFDLRFEKCFLGKWNWHEGVLPLSKKYPDRCLPPVFGVDYYKLLSNAKIVYNRHLDNTRYSGNIRMFEATGLGACLLTDRPRLSSQYFELDSEIVCYDTSEECAEKAKYLLEHPAKRKEIARRGQERTLRDHTVKTRCETMHAGIRHYLLK